MGAITRLNSVQFEAMNVNEMVGVTLVYKSVNRDGETHFSGLNFAGDEYTPKDKTQDEIFRVWKNVVATFWTVKAIEAGLRVDNGGIASKLRAGTPAESWIERAMKFWKENGENNESHQSKNGIFEKSHRYRH